jgi:uncharacterized protein YkwD
MVAAPAQAKPSSLALRAAEGFSVLAGSTVTNTGPSLVSGDLGLHPGSSVTGFPPGRVAGSQHVGDVSAQRAKADLTTTYNAVAGNPYTATSPPDIGGRTFSPGVYRSGAVPSLGLTGRVTLDGQGDPQAAFIFQIPSTLVTASGSSVRLVNGAQACNVYWQVGSSATLGTGTALQGNVLALTSISANDGASVNGRLLARNGAVTLINNRITRPLCSTWAGSAPAPPPARSLDIRLSTPAVVGRTTALVVKAVNPFAPVSGLGVQFGGRRDVFGSSACQVGSSGILPRIFNPGARSRLVARHRFRKPGREKVVVRIDSGGCSSALTSVYRTVIVTTTKPGQRPRRLRVGRPTSSKPRGAVLPLARAASSGLAIASGARNCTGAGAAVVSSAASRRAARTSLLCLLNAERRAKRLPGLRINRRLLKAAERHSRSMVKRRYFSHVGPGGSSMFDRVRASGYLKKAGRWTIGENIGYGATSSSSPGLMTRSWMASTPHRANILNRKFREVGLGIVSGTPARGGPAGGTYTTEFGRR